MFSKDPNVLRLHKETLSSIRRPRYLLFYLLSTFFIILSHDLFIIFNLVYKTLIYSMFLFYPVYPKSIKSVLLPIVIVYQCVTFIPILITQITLIIVPLFYPLRLMFIDNLNLYFEFIYLNLTTMISNFDIFDTIQELKYQILLFPYFLLFKLYKLVFYILPYILTFERISKILFINLWGFFMMNLIFMFYDGKLSKLKIELSRVFPEYKPLYYWAKLSSLTYKLIINFFKNIYYLIVKIIMFFANTYGSILSISTRVCKKLGIIGDILLIPISFSWAAIPLLLPYYISWGWLIPSLLLFGFNIVIGGGIIKKNWK
jgi:hypothetical protein